MKNPKNLLGSTRQHWAIFATWLATSAAIALTANAATSTNDLPSAGEPAELGQSVNGFQDDFDGPARDPNWVAVGPGGDHSVGAHLSRATGK